MPGQQLIQALSQQEGDEGLGLDVLPREEALIAELRGTDASPEALAQARPELSLALSQKLDEIASTARASAASARP